MLRTKIMALGAFVAFSLLATQSNATLMLTTDGIDAGFSLSTFATLNPGVTGGYGPFGIGVDSSHHVIVSNSADSTRYVFNDTDNLTVSDALYTHQSQSYTTGYTSSGGKVYGADNPPTGGGKRFVQFNDDGSINHVLTGVAPLPYLGMATNPVNGHIIANSSEGIIDIDPNANGGNGAYIKTGIPNGDGLSISPDGSTVYVAGAGQIDAYNLADGHELNHWTSANGPDGTGVITSATSPLNGQIIVNNNDGTVGLLDPTTGIETTIADNGTRGDYVSPDWFNGTLFLIQSEGVMRLSCGKDCAIGVPVPSSVPEPATVSLLALALLGLYFSQRRKFQA